MENFQEILRMECKINYRYLYKINYKLSNVIPTLFESDLLLKPIIPVFPGEYND